MKKTMLTAAAAFAALAVPAAAHAGSAEGKIQVKLLATGVLPDGDISRINNPGVLALPANAALAANPHTYASDNVVPTVAIEYFFTPNVSVETICCVTKHHVNGAGSLATTNLVNNISIIPATVTVKYHAPLGPIKPYLGVGPTLFLVLDSEPGATAATFSSTTKLSSEAGVVVQAGVDVPLGSSGYALSLDAKKYWVSTNARWYNAAGVEQLSTRHKLDPWVLSAGVAYRF
ncbi:OmpW family protein [Novosphingobium bradum]|uniref:OmpW family protein n=1 Tax=Novosphingobium bradum TaxID=1737444 RepID=A0ABV7IRS2_9SPHN